MNIENGKFVKSREYILSFCQRVINLFIQDLTVFIITDLNLTRCFIILALLFCISIELNIKYMYKGCVDRFEIARARV